MKTKELVSRLEAIRQELREDYKTYKDEQYDHETTHLLSPIMNLLTNY